MSNNGPSKQRDHRGHRYNIRKRELDGKFALWALMTDAELGIEPPDSPYADFKRWVMVSVHETRKQAFRAMDAAKGGSAHMSGNMPHKAKGA